MATRSSKDLERGLEEPKTEALQEKSDLSIEKHSSEEEPDIPLEPKPSGPPLDEFPEGGRGWLVVAGVAGVMFTNFGYANAFG